MYPYPDLGQSIESAKIVLANFTGTPVERNELVHHGYTVGGFALSQIFPDNTPPMFGSGPAVACTEDECVNHLRDFTASQSGGMRSVGALPWLQILLFVMELLKKRSQP